MGAPPRGIQSSHCSSNRRHLCVNSAVAVVTYPSLANSIANDTQPSGSLAEMPDRQNLTYFAKFPRKVFTSNLKRSSARKRTPQAPRTFETRRPARSEKCRFTGLLRPVHLKKTYQRHSALKLNLINRHNHCSNGVKPAITMDPELLKSCEHAEIRH